MRGGKGGNNGASIQSHHMGTPRRVRPRHTFTGLSLLVTYEDSHQSFTSDQTKMFHYNYPHSLIPTLRYGIKTI